MQQYDHLPTCPHCGARHVFPRNVDHAPRTATAVAVEEVDSPCCEPADPDHTLTSGHSVFCRDLPTPETAQFQPYATDAVMVSDGDLCTFAPPVGLPRCITPAVTHLVVRDSSADDVMTLLACLEHDRVARYTGRVLTEHPFDAVCRSTDTRIVLDPDAVGGSRCVVSAAPGQAAA